MTVVTLPQASRQMRGFYVPEFEVRIEGAGLPQNVLRDVVQLTYHDDVGGLDGFELVVNNWDPQRLRFKYVGSETATQIENEPQSTEEHLYRLFEPCNKTVDIRMGYAGHLRTMLTGSFTTMEPTFPSQGASTLSIRGLNVLHQLRRKPYDWAWEDKTDSEIAQNLATLQDPDTHGPRFPVPIETDPNVREPVIPYVAQQNQTDIDFLFTRARERGYVLYLLEKDEERGLKRRLYFGPSHGGKGLSLHPVTYKLEWGSDLSEFKPTLTTANQVRSVTVRGWDRQKKEAIEAKVELTKDPELNRNRDLQRLLERCDPRDDVVVSEPVFTKKQAEDRARALLMDRQKTMVQATGTTVGLPDLRAGQLIDIDKLGARFSRTYFLLTTTHVMGEQGYTTQFTCRREFRSGEQAHL